MPLGRFQVSWGAASGLVKDRVTNTLYFQIDQATPIDPTDWQQLADDLRDIYKTYAFTGGSKLEVRAYDMADTKPRPEKAYSTATTTGSIPAGAAQVAICLSYFSDRNLPRQRGRIYLGPYVPSARLIPSATMDQIMAIGNAFTGLGGVNVDWQVYSQIDGVGRKVTDYWCDDSWDIIRSRKIQATTRKTAKTNE